MSAFGARAVMLSALQDVAPEADLSLLDDEIELRDQLDIDSMDFLNFVIGVHARTGIDIPERDYPKLATPGRCVAYLQARGGA